MTTHPTPEAPSDGLIEHMGERAETILIGTMVGFGIALLLTGEVLSWIL